jgi:hypothetical protein
MAGMRAFMRFSPMREVHYYRLAACLLISATALLYPVSKRANREVQPSGKIGEAIPGFVNGPQSRQEDISISDSSKDIQSKRPPIYGIALCIDGYLAMFLGWRWRVRNNQLCRDWWTGFVLMVLGFAISVCGGWLCIQRIV